MLECSTYKIPEVKSGKRYKSNKTLDNYMNIEDIILKRHMCFLSLMLNRKVDYLFSNLYEISS